MLIYGHLLHNQWLDLKASIRAKSRWFNVIAIASLLIYVVIVLMAIGLLYKEIFFGAHTTADVVGSLNRHLLEIFFGMFCLRFFLQRGPRIKIQPYLHLPIPRATLVRFFQIFSLLSFHNVLPFLFFVPFWIRYFLWEGYTPIEAGSWLAGIALIILVSHFCINALRSLLRRSSRHFVVIVSAIAGMIVLDQMVNTNFLRLVSTALFSELASGNVVLLGLLSSFSLSVMLLSFGLMRENLRRSAHAPAQTPQASFLKFKPRYGQVLNLLVLELKMMWRNQRPKHYFLLSLVFAAAYITVLMAQSDTFRLSAINAVIGLFISGTFALNYGQLMFSWESTYFDGLLARNIRLDELVLSKLMLLQGSCLFFFLITLPVFIWLNPDLLLLHVTFLFYNAGITCVLMLALAVRNRRRVNISKSGSFFNYEGFSASHWLWIIPTITPPALLLHHLQSIQWTALLFIGGIGVTSLVLSRQWSSYFTRQLVERKYSMAMGFRQHEH